MSSFIAGIGVNTPFTKDHELVPTLLREDDRLPGVWHVYAGFTYCCALGVRAVWCAVWQWAVAAGGVAESDGFGFPRYNGLCTC